MPDFIVGVDASLTDTGIGIVDKTGKIIDSRSIKTKATPVDHTRIDFIVEKFFDCVNPYIAKGKVSFMFEDVVFGRNGKGTARSELLGVIRWCIRQEGLDAVGMTPSAWKSFVLHPAKVPRKSDESKKAINQWLENNRGFFTNNLNISDGCGLGIVGHAYYVQGKRLSVRALSTIG